MILNFILIDFILNVNENINVVFIYNNDHENIKNE